MHVNDAELPAAELADAEHEAILVDEQRSIVLSLIGAVVLAGLGIAWGIAIDSAIILLDGVWGLIGLALSAVTLRVTMLVDQGPSSRYPFGREALGPLILGVQGLVLAGALTYAAIDAVQVIIDGGSQTPFGSALLYAVISFIGAFGIYLYMRTRSTHSELVRAEAAQWVSGALLSMAMLVGFAAGALMHGTQWQHASDYIDPVLVIVAALILAPIPVGMLRTMFNELLEGAPGPVVEAPIRAAIEAACTHFHLPQPQAVRIGKLGRKVYAEVDFLIHDDPHDRWTVEEADRIRRFIMEHADQPGQSLWLNVELHVDPDWDA